MKRKISIVLLGLLLLAAAIANLLLISKPPERMTTFFRTHQYEDRDGNTILRPDYETDVSAMIADMAGINVAVLFATGFLVLSGGLLSSPSQRSEPSFQKIAPPQRPNDRSDTARVILFSGAVGIVVAAIVDALTGQIGGMDGWSAVGTIFGGMVVAVTPSCVIALFFKGRVRLVIALTLTPCFVLFFSVLNAHYGSIQKPLDPSVYFNNSLAPSR